MYVCMYAKDDQFMTLDSIKGCPIQFRLYDAIIGSLSNNVFE